MQRNLLAAVLIAAVVLIGVVVAFNQKIDTVAQPSSTEILFRPITFGNSSTVDYSTAQRTLETKTARESQVVWIIAILAIGGGVAFALSRNTTPPQK